MIKNILISVIIPCYNRKKQLTRAIKSVLSQTLQNVEILVIDDGSEENLKPICDSFNDNRIRFLRNEKHTNANVARNRGIKAAKGEYIAMLDSDDEFLPHHLERRLEKMQEWNCDGIFGSTYICDGEHNRLNISRPLQPNEKMIDYILGTGSATTPTHFYKLEAALAILWDETLKRHQDYDFSIRFAAKFDFRSDYEPTVVINWRKGEKRTVDFDSNIAFIEKYKTEVSPYILCNYLIGQYKLSVSEKNRAIQKYYLKEIKKRIHFLSFSDWSNVNQSKNTALSFLNFLINLFFSRILKNNI